MGDCEEKVLALSHKILWYERYAKDNPNVPPYYQVGFFDCDNPFELGIITVDRERLIFNLSTKELRKENEKRCHL